MFHLQHGAKGSTPQVFLGGGQFPATIQTCTDFLFFSVTISHIFIFYDFPAPLGFAKGFSMFFAATKCYLDGLQGWDFHMNTIIRLMDTILELKHTGISGMFLLKYSGISLKHMFLSDIFLWILNIVSGIP